MKGLEKRVSAVEAGRQPLFSEAEIERILVSVLNEQSDASRARKLPIELFDEILAGDEKCLTSGL